MKKVAQAKTAKPKVNTGNLFKSLSLPILRHRGAATSPVRKENPKVEKPVKPYAVQKVDFPRLAQLSAILKAERRFDFKPSWVLCFFGPIILCYLILHAELAERLQISFCYHPPIGMPSSGWLSVLQSHFCSYRRVCVFDRLSDCELGPIDSRVPLNVLLSDLPQLLNSYTVNGIISFSSDLWDVLNTQRFPYNGKAPKVKLIDYFAPGCDDDAKEDMAFEAFYGGHDIYLGSYHWISNDDMKRCLREAVISQEYLFSFAKEISKQILPSSLNYEQVLDLIDPSNVITRRVTQRLLEHSFYATNYFATTFVPGLHCNTVPSIFRGAVHRMHVYYLGQRSRWTDRLFRERILIDAFGDVTGFNLSLVDILKWMQLINRLHEAVHETPLIVSALSVWNILSGCRQLVESHSPTTDYLMSLSTVLCNATFNNTQCFAWIKSFNFSEGETIALYTLLRGYVLLSPPTATANEKLKQLSDLNNFFAILNATARNITSSFTAANVSENTRTFTELLFVMLRKFGLPKGEDEKMFELFALTTCALRSDWWSDMGSRIINTVLPIKQLLGCIRTEGRIQVVTSEELQTTVGCLISEYNLLSTVEFKKDNNETEVLPSLWEYTINMVDYLLDSNSSLDEDADSYHFSGYNYPYAIVRDVIDEAIMELHGRRGKRIGRFVQPFPRKAIVRYPPFYPLMHLPFVFTLFFFAHSMHMLLVAARERQQGFSSYMKVSGLKWVTFLTSFLIRALVIYFLSGVILFYVLLDVAVINEGTVLWSIVLYASCSVAAATQCYLLYTTFPTLCSVMAAGSLVYIIGYVTFEVILYFFSNIGYIVQMILSIFLPQLAWNFGCVSVTAYARLEEELSWKKLNVSFFENKNYTIGWSLVALQCNSLFNIMVALLIDLGVLSHLIHCAKLTLKKLRRRRNEVRSDVGLHFTKTLPHEIPLAPVGLSVSSLSHSFRKNGNIPAVILTNVTVDFYEGQITVIYGEEHSGKSTLMRLLGGLLTPHGGSILVPGKKDKLVVPTFNDIAYCPEKFCLFENLTVREHLDFYQRLRGCRNRSMACRSIIMETGLMAFSSVRAGCLSIQMKRILQIAVAIVCDARVWLLDQPTKGLKPINRRILWNFLIRHRNGRTIIVTSSSYLEAETISDRIAILSRKTLLCCGSFTFLRNQTNLGFKMKLRKMPMDDKDIVSTNAENHWTRHILSRLMPEAEITKYGQEKIHVAIPLVDFKILRKLIAKIERMLGEFACDSYVLSSATLEQVVEKVSNMSIAPDQLITRTNSQSEQIGANPEFVPKRTDAFTTSWKGDRLCENALARFLNYSFLLGLSKMFENNNKILYNSKDCIVTPFCQIEAIVKRRYLKLVRDKWALFFMVLFPAILLSMVTKAISIANSTGNMMDDDVEMTPFSSVGDSLAIFFNFTHPDIKTEAVHWKKYLLQMFRNRRVLKGLDENFTILTTLPEGNCTDQPLDYIPTFENLYNPKILVHENDFLYDARKLGIASWTGGFSGAASENSPAAVNYSKLADHALKIYTNVQRLLATESDTKSRGNEIMQLVRNFSLLTPTLSVASNVKIWYPGSSCSSLSKSMSIMNNAMLYTPSSNQSTNVVEIRSHLGSLKTFQLHRMYRLVELEKYTEGISLRYAAVFAVVVSISSLAGPVASWAVKEKSAGIKYIMICQGATFGVFVKDTCPDVVPWKPLAQFISSFIPQFYLFDALVALNGPCKGDLFADLFDDRCFLEFGGLKRSLWAIFALVMMGATAFVVLIAVENQQLRKECNAYYVALLSLQPKKKRAYEIHALSDLSSLFSNFATFKEAIKEAAIKQTVNLIRSIRPGECIGIFGANGVGKSSVLRIAMARSRASYFGKMSFKELFKNAFTPMGNGFCYCPQWDALDESLTVRETLVFYAALYGVSKTSRLSVVSYYLHRFDMSNIADTKNSSLSMDMRRRLSIASALMGPCSILVLDEPTSRRKINHNDVTKVAN
ncbi:ATP binding cassette sub family A [Trichuris trichiura]|uniref:ATP binding cassette sub family A n=1 Tax=Trichuris trichiura TaxID=36087 RepID=A0A077Z3H7_TRITR|nr:ATP binding cassette sub family A [Trichuris trichiura]